MRRRYGFILTSTKTYGCKHCGQWQRFSSFDWLALMFCKLHERKCEESRS
jgi:hypothetical protein